MCFNGVDYTTQSIDVLNIALPTPIIMESSINIDGVVVTYNRLPIKSYNFYNVGLFELVDYIIVHKDTLAVLRDVICFEDMYINDDVILKIMVPIGEIDRFDVRVFNVVAFNAAT